jgi:hypothetical protein
MWRPWLLVVLAGCASLAGCAHVSLSRHDLDDVRRVAVVARVVGGPTSRVFRDDPAWRGRLAERELDDPEGDRRLALVLANGSFDKGPDGSRRLAAGSISRFELAESLRAQVVSGLPRRAPWTGGLVPPQDVARELESYLVQDASGSDPDYGRLKTLRVDAILELTVEDYGLRSERARVGAFLVVTARLFRVGGPTLYRRHLVLDEVTAGREGDDPFAVAKDAGLFARRVKGLAEELGRQVATDLTPSP